MRCVVRSLSLMAVFCGSAGFMLPSMMFQGNVGSDSCLSDAPFGVPTTSHPCGAAWKPLLFQTVTRSRPFYYLGLAPSSTKEDATTPDQGASISDGDALAEARIVMKGQATGGYFRAHARNEAYFNRNLRGALKEVGKGETEIVVEGKTSAIRSFVRWCRKGPGLSQRIEDVAVDWSEYTGIFEGFEVFADEPAGNKPPGVP